jgi:hypothetical protein
MLARRSRSPLPRQTFMVLEFLGGPWDGQVEKVDDRAMTVAVPMPPDVDYRPYPGPRDYSRIGVYHIRRGGQARAIHYADWLGEA